MEIKKILIANRGEIAIRIIRTCKEMGIKTVALCPLPGDEDNFRETKLADEFYYLQEEGILGYLDQKKLLQIAKRAGADAIHPGYGFLAENGDFAELCQKNGIKFIGPRPETLRELSDKIRAKEIARKVGIPLMPSSKEIETGKELLKTVKKIKPPFLLKAANGGGGIGIELFEEKKDKKELIESYLRLKRQVSNTFGSDKIFVEKFIKEPHHIEFQILGDGRGKVVHLFERDCSLQRRHQKLVEEAPSPVLDKKLREKKMGKLAVKLGEHLKYEGVGTVEFLVDRDKNFYFLEVNPRLQVEHPVTEAITGFDLVKEQIKIAQGQKLEIKQKHIKLSGWAMEFRIYAEDAKEDFKSGSGEITSFLPPGGKGIEIHSFCHIGQEVLPYFDSLLLKLVVFAKDRAEVISRAKRALDEIVLEGVPTLLPFYRFLLQNEDFIEGRISTTFIKKSGILEQFKKLEKKPFEPKKVLPKEFNKKELAAILAKVYEEVSFKEEEKEKEQNNWKVQERLEMIRRETL